MTCFCFTVTSGNEISLADIIGKLFSYPIQIFIYLGGQSVRTWFQTVLSLLLHSELNSGGIIKLVVSCVHIFISFKTKSFLNYIFYTVIHHLIIFLEACHPGFFHGGFSTEINQPILNLSMWFLYWWQCVCFYQVYSKGI